MTRFWLWLVFELHLDSERLGLVMCMLALHSWRRALRLRLHRLRTNWPWTLIGILLRFCTRPIMLSIGGSFCGTRLSGCILRRTPNYHLLKALTSSTSPKAPSPSNALLTSTLFLSFLSPLLFPFHGHFLTASFPFSRGGHFPFFNNLRAAEYRIHLNNLR